MSRSATPTEFMAKSWIFIAQSLIFGGLASFSLIVGPLCLFGFMKKANGLPATDAGIALTAIGVPLSLVFALAVYNLSARRRPLLRLCREGIEFVQIGASSLDGIPLIPGLVHIAWLILSTQGFRKRVVRVPWDDIQDVWVSGPPMVRRLTIVVSRSVTTTDDFPLEAPLSDQIAFTADVFSTPLDEIDAAIQSNAEHPMDREHLASWADVEPDHV